MWFWALIIFCITLNTVEGFTSTVTACDGNWLNLKCPVPMTIISANYGRLDKTTCPSGYAIGSAQLDTTSCSEATSLSVVNSICNGLLNCSVNASTAVFGDPCSTIAKYLTATYSCPVTVSTNVVCDGTTLSFGCPTGLIYIWTSNYGRLDRCTCPGGFGIGSGPLQFTACTASTSLSVVNTQCNGKPNCTFGVNINIFGGDPCVNTYKYLLTTYSCIEISNQVACENSALTLQCGSGVIEILTANYGRLDETVCMAGMAAGDPALSTTTCSASNSFDVVNNICNGQQSCSIPATDTQFGGDPCSGIEKYLTVTFYCQVASTNTITPYCTTTSSTTTSSSTTSSTATTSTTSTSTTTSTTTTPTTTSTTTTTPTTTTSTTTTPTTTSTTSTPTTTSTSTSTTRTTTTTPTTTSTTTTPTTTSTTRTTTTTPTTTSTTTTPTTTSTTRTTTTTPTTTSTTTTPTTTSTTRTTTSTTPTTTSTTTTPTTTSTTTTPTTTSSTTTTSTTSSTAAPVVLQLGTTANMVAVGPVLSASKISGSDWIKWVLLTTVCLIACATIATCCCLTIVSSRKRHRNNHQCSQTLNINKTEHF